MSILLMSLLYGVSVDCPNIINLGIGLHLDIKQPIVMNEVRTDCCTASGITCVNQRVTQIMWGGAPGLGGSINGSALPPNLFNFDVSFASVTGPIPILPAGISYFAVQGNKMSGDVPPLPSSLDQLILGLPNSPGNHFSGSIVLSSPTNVKINFNLITDITIQSTTSLSNCDLSNNPLLGNPRLTALPMCTKNNLYSANLLPITISTLFSTTKLFLPTAMTTKYIQSSLLPAKRTTTSKSTSDLFITSIVTNQITSPNQIRQTNTNKETDQTTLDDFQSVQDDNESVTSTTVTLKAANSNWRSFNLKMSKSTLIFNFQPLEQIISTDQFINIVFKLMLNAIILGLVGVKIPLKRAFHARFKKEKIAINSEFNESKRGENY